jgi:hypothetical protein
MPELVMPVRALSAEDVLDLAHETDDAAAAIAADAISAALTREGRSIPRRPQ